MLQSIHAVAPEGTKLTVAPTMPIIGIGRAPVIAAIPAYNEERFIGSVVLSARRHVDIVVVVDDGSSDRTADLAEAAGAVVVRHGANRGYGAAINTAFGEARRLQAAALVLVDGDGQHYASDIDAVLAPVLNDEADVSVGSRFLAVKNDIPAYRKVGQHALTIATNISSGVRLSDSQSGFRAFSNKAIEAISFQVISWSVMSEMQFLIHEHGLRVAEVPIGVIYAEPAKRNPIGHGMAVINGIIRLVSVGRPLLFFGVPGMIVLALGFWLGLDVANTFERKQELAAGHAMITVLLVIIGVLAVFVGLMLNAMRMMFGELRHASR